MMAPARFTEKESQLDERIPEEPGDHRVARHRPSSSRAAPAETVAATASYTIGVSNTLTNNGWREEMICSINAQALVSGEVASLSISHRDTDAAGQLEDIRNLIAEDVDAIIVNPADREALDARWPRPRRPASR